MMKHAHLLGLFLFQSLIEVNASFVQPKGPYASKKFRINPL